MIFGLLRYKKNDAVAVPPRRERVGAKLRRSASLAGLTICACYSSCDDLPSSASTTGELGNGTFEYSCASLGDAVCEHGAVEQQFPDCIAVGGAFRLDYTLKDLSDRDDEHPTSSLSVDSASATFFSLDHGEFTAEQPGRAALLAFDNEKVVDFIHLDIVTPEAMEIVALDPEDSVEVLHLASGEAASFRVFPRTTQCAVLGGAVTAEAVSNHPVVVATSVLDVVELRGDVPGTATVTVKLGELTQEIRVEVSGAPVRHHDDMTSSDGGSSSGAAGSDSSSSSSDSSSSSEGTGG
jgi:hypothetical protein